MSYKIYKADCLNILPKLKEKSIDMVLTDLPYGTTKCKWDITLPFNKIWENINQLVKDNAAIVLFGNEPFSSLLRISNLKNFKFDWIWQKEKGSGFQIVKYRPLISTELISIFGKNRINYYPQMIQREKIINGSWAVSKSQTIPLGKINKKRIKLTHRFPTNILKFNKVSKAIFHPTQKPIKLLEYLIKTYTKENETVLDFTMGSGSTGVACMNTNRNFIGIEKEKKYYDIAKKRLEENKK